MNINVINFNKISNKYKNGYKESGKNILDIHSNKEFKLFSYPALYYMKNLSFKGDSFKERLSMQLKNSSEDELFLFLDEELRKKAAANKISQQLSEDMIQDTIMDIYMLVSESKINNKPQSELVEGINKIYMGMKMKRKDYPNEFGIRSIYEEAGLDDDFHHLNILDVTPDDEEHKLKPLSLPSEKEIIEKRQNLSKVLSNTNLDERSESILKDRYLQTPPIKYKDITQKYQICEQGAILLVKRAILRAQIANNALPEQTKEKIKDIGEVLNTDYDTAQNAVIKNPYLLNHTKEEFKEKISSVVKAFSDNGLTEETYTVCCAKHTELLCKGANAIEKNIREVADGFKEYGITLNDYIKACIKQPHLFYQTYDNLKKNIIKTAEKFKDNGLTSGMYLKSCIRQPSLFCSSPETVEHNIKGTVEKFLQNGLNIDKYIKAAIKMPTLFATPPETIENNIINLVGKFKDNNLTIDKYVKACIKKPSLFYQSPNTIEQNIKGTVQKFEKEGLTTNDYIKAACKAETLFSIKPERVEKNIKDALNAFENNGLTKEKYIKVCLKNPSLFYSTPDRITKHLNGVVNAFNNNNLTTDDYMQCCIKQPPLLGLANETIVNNVTGVVEKYKNKGLSLDDYLRTCKQAPSLFQNRPEKVAEHIDIMRFSLFNANNNISDEDAIKKILSNGIALSYSTKLTLINNLIIPKMFEGEHIPSMLRRGGHYEEKLTNYIKEHSDKTYNINVKEFNTGTDCIEILDKCLKELSQNATGRDDIFKLNVIK